MCYDLRVRGPNISNGSKVVTDIHAGMGIAGWKLVYTSEGRPGVLGVCFVSRGFVLRFFVPRVPRPWAIWKVYMRKPSSCVLRPL